MAEINFLLKSARPRLRSSISSNKILWNNNASSLQEVLQRRLVTFTKEVWFAATAYLKKLEASFSSVVFSDQTKNNTIQLVDSLRTYMRDITMSMLVNLDLLKQADGSHFSQINGLEELSTLVQIRLRRLQNPTDCRKAKLLLGDLEDHNCGFGCQVHYLTYCFQVAYATGRTFLLKPNQKGFGKWWMENFEEFSDTCEAQDTADEKVEKLLYETVNSSTRVMQCAWKLHLQRQKLHAAPLAVPEDLAPKLSKYHGEPSAWFVGQLAKYLTRPRPVLKQDLEKLLAAYDFSESDQSPVVGIHVRRTDKIIYKEADFHNFSEYMVYVDRYFDFLDKRRQTAEDYQSQSTIASKLHNYSAPKVLRRAFIATDDPKVFKEAETLYPHYVFYGDRNRAVSASVNRRSTSDSIRDVVLDVLLLSRTNYLVCTLSSNICRIAYELMQTRHRRLGDASLLVQSLDSVYFVFGGQPTPCKMTDVDERNDLGPGELVSLIGSRLDGYMEVSRDQGKTNIQIPVYKCRPLVLTAPMLNYSSLP
ncbi:unnamed protein product [Calicophoron daubneyi]|uniref:GT23 domain-containing protein n=1 Tax=Calicophoron daubneyi TaxID=300641 RepID=A0AAV2T656_CALDB